MNSELDISQYFEQIKWGGSDYNDYNDYNESNVEVLVRYYKRLCNLVQPPAYNIETFSDTCLPQGHLQMLVSKLWLFLAGALSALVTKHPSTPWRSDDYFFRENEVLKAFLDSIRTPSNTKLLNEFNEIFNEWHIWRKWTFTRIRRKPVELYEDYFEIRDLIEEYRGILDSIMSMCDKLKCDTDVSGRELTLCINSLFQVTKRLRFLCSCESLNDNVNYYKSSKDTISSNVNSNITCPENTLIISLFHQLSELYLKEDNVNAATTYQNVVQELSKWPNKITSGDDFDSSKGTKLKGIGKKTCQFIDEILQTGKLGKVNEKIELLGDATKPPDNCNDDMSCDDMSCESVHDRDIEEVKMEIKELDITDDVISLFEVPDEAFSKSITLPLLFREEGKFLIKDYCFECSVACEELTTKYLEDYDSEDVTQQIRPDKYTSCLTTPEITKKFMTEHKHELENLCSIGQEWLKKYDNYYAKIFKERNSYHPGQKEAFLFFQPKESTSINFLLDSEIDETDIISTENSVVHRTQIICDEILLTMNSYDTKMMSISSSPSPIKCGKKICVGAKEIDMMYDFNIYYDREGMEKFLDHEMCLHYSRWKVCNKPIDLPNECHTDEDNKLCCKCKIIRCVDCSYKILPFLKGGNKYTCGKCKQNGLCIFCMYVGGSGEYSLAADSEIISCDDGCCNTYCVHCIDEYRITYPKCTYCSTYYCSLCFIECPGCQDSVCKGCMYERGGSFYCPCCDTLYCPGCQQTIQMKCVGCDRNVCEESCIESNCDICHNQYCTDCDEKIENCSVCENDVCEKCWDEGNNCCNNCTHNKDSNT